MYQLPPASTFAGITTSGTINTQVATAVIAAPGALSLIHI